MNTTTAKKLGEVLAFASVSNETIEEHEALFRDALGVEMTAHIIEMNDIHAKNILHVAEISNKKDTVTEASGKSAQKLRAMRDLYLGKKDTVVKELFEWLTFSEGAAYGHWSLVKGMAEEQDGLPAQAGEALLELADDAINFHFELLNHIASELEEEGQQAI